MMLSSSVLCMKMGQENSDEIKQIFAICVIISVIFINWYGKFVMTQDDVQRKISISLDAWISSNNYAFLAIVAHYVWNGSLGLSCWVTIFITIGSNLCYGGAPHQFLRACWWTFWREHGRSTVGHVQVLWDWTLCKLCSFCLRAY